MDQSIGMVHGSKLTNQGTKWTKTGRPPAPRAAPEQDRQTLANDLHLVDTVGIEHSA